MNESTPYDLTGRYLGYSLNFPSKVRKDWLLNKQDPLVFNNGYGCKVKWKNLGGGIWKAWLEETNVSGNKVLDFRK